MNSGLLKRFGYFFGGFAIGLVILAFFLNGKKVSCDYGPDARVLKNINSKTIVYSNDVLTFMQNKSIDTTQINYILHRGDIDFSKSEARKKPCGIYCVEGKINNTNAIITIENCKKTATLKEMQFKH